jgi:hypothetical protein
MNVARRLEGKGDGSGERDLRRRVRAVFFQDHQPVGVWCGISWAANDREMRR